MSKRNRKSAIAEARSNRQPIASLAVVSFDSTDVSQAENSGHHVLRPSPIAPSVAAGSTQRVSSR
jgi:hypothetical protein